jgi:hypothetical protein
MKKLIVASVSATLLITCILIYSCKKESGNAPVKKNDVFHRVTTWLDQQKHTSQPNKASNIDLLKQNLDFSGLKYESFNDGDQLIIIPIRDEFKSTKNSYRNSFAALVLIDDRGNIIKNGRIAVFTSATTASVNEIPENTFNKVLNTQPVACDGTFQFLSVTGQLLHKFNYINGQINKFSEVRPQNSGNTKTGMDSRANEGCTDWYIVTTYYANGVPVQQEYEYVGTTCEGCDDPNLESLCPDGDGTGSGSSGGVTDEITKQYIFKQGRK